MNLGDVLDRPDDPVAVPQGDAHGGTNAVPPDRVGRGQPLVAERIARREADPFCHDAANDLVGHGRDGRRAVLQVVPDARDLAHEPSVAPQHDESAMGGERLEGDVERTSQRVADGVGRDEVLGEVDQELERAVLPRSLDLVLLPRNRAEAEVER